jgi:hypothetical protein
MIAFCFYPYRDKSLREMPGAKLLVAQPFLAVHARRVPVPQSCVGNCG